MPIFFSCTRRATELREDTDLSIHNAVLYLVLKETKRLAKGVWRKVPLLLLCQYFFLAQGTRQSERGSIDKLYDRVSDKCNAVQGKKMQ